MIYHILIFRKGNPSTIEFDCIADKPREAVREVLNVLPEPFQSETFSLEIYERRTFRLPKGIIKTRWPEEQK